jgi:hypothetical protein
MPGRSDVQPKIGADRAKLRMIAPEEEAKTAHYEKWWDDLFGTDGFCRTACQTCNEIVACLNFL